MKNLAVSSAVLIIASCAAFSVAQWTPDPFCPYPSDHVTRYPYYGNCSLYWECYNGAKYVMSCPEGLEFNAPLQQCDAPEITNCDPYASTTDNPNPTTNPTHSTETPSPGPLCPFPSEELVYFPYPGDCTKYWECFEGKSYLYNCPSGLWWHEEISECDYPGPYCDNSTTITPAPTTPTPDVTTSATTSWTPDSQCPNPPSDVPVYIPYYGDCTKYWECGPDGVTYLYTCPDGLWWHQAIAECDYPGDYCVNTTTVAPSTTTKTTITPEPTTTDAPQPQCPNPPSEVPVYIPYYGDCTKYWECGPDGSKYLYTCPDGLWWHQEIAKCDYPGSYCNNSTSTVNPSPTTAAPTPQPTPTCPSSPTEDPVYFPYWGDCTKYWECSDGVAYLYTCPGGLWWHQNKSQCDYPGEFCYTWPSCPYFPTEEPIYYPFDSDCTKYWECSNGDRYLYTCPSGLWWHQEIKECDYPGSFCFNSTVAQTRR